MCYKKDLYLEKLEWLDNSINHDFSTNQYNDTFKSVDDFLLTLTNDNTINPYIFNAFVNKLYDKIHDENIINV